MSKWYFVWGLSSPQQSLHSVSSQSSSWMLMGSRLGRAQSSHCDLGGKAMETWRNEEPWSRSQGHCIFHLCFTFTTPGVCTEIQNTLSSWEIPKSFFAGFVSHFKWQEHSPWPKRYLHGVRKKKCVQLSSVDCFIFRLMEIQIKPSEHNHPDSPSHVLLIITSFIFMMKNRWYQCHISMCIISSEEEISHISCTYQNICTYQQQKAELMDYLVTKSELPFRKDHLN